MSRDAHQVSDFVNTEVLDVSQDHGRLLPVTEPIEQTHGYGAVRWRRLRWRACDGTKTAGFAILRADRIDAETTYRRDQPTNADGRDIPGTNGTHQSDEGLMHQVLRCRLVTASEAGSAAIHLTEDRVVEQHQTILGCDVMLLSADHGDPSPALHPYDDTDRLFPSIHQQFPK